MYPSPSRFRPKMSFQKRDNQRLTKLHFHLEHSLIFHFNIGNHRLQKCNLTRLGPVSEGADESLILRI
jgi:hypothetical protein